MEGYLVKWTNMISRWKKRYVVIDKDKLYYYKEKGGKILGSYSLRNVDITISHSDPSGFTLKFGNGEATKFKAPDTNERQKWLIAAKAGKIIGEEHNQQESTKAMNGITLLKAQLMDILRNRILSGSTKLSKDMNNIITLQGQLEHSVDGLLKVLEENKVDIPEAKNYSTTIKTVINKLKVLINLSNRGK